MFLLITVLATIIPVFVIKEIHHSKALSSDLVNDRVQLEALQRKAYFKTNDLWPFFRVSLYKINRMSVLALSAVSFSAKCCFSFTVKLLIGTGKGKKYFSGGYLHSLN